jgi:hypothetical protein
MASLTNMCYKVVANNNLDINKLPSSFQSFLTCCNKDVIEVEKVAQSEHFSCLKYALDIKQFSDWDATEALNHACKSNQFESAKCLIDAGTSTFDDSLDIICFNDNATCLKYMIESGKLLWNEKIFENILHYDAVNCFIYMENEAHYIIPINLNDTILAFDSLKILKYLHENGSFIVPFNDYHDFINTMCNYESIKCVMYTIQNDIFDVTDVADTTLLYDSDYILEHIVNTDGIDFTIMDTFVISVANVNEQRYNTLGAFDCMCVIYEKLTENQKKILLEEAFENDLTHFIDFIISKQDLSEVRSFYINLFNRMSS